MSPRFLAPDLSLFAPAKLIEEIDAEQIITEIKASILARWAEIRTGRPDLPALDTLGLETEPMTILIEAFAYRETLLRALVNDKARAVLLAYASGADLDHIGALVGVERAAIDAENGIYEADDRFRRRIQLAPEAFSVAGPAGAYEFHALTIDPSILDAYAWTPRVGEVHVAVIGTNIEPVSDAILTKLIRRFRLDDVVPLTDTVFVRKAEIIPFDITYNVAIASGLDALSVKTAVDNALTSHLLGRVEATRSRSKSYIGAPIYRSGLIAAGMSVGIENFVLTSPLGDVTPQSHQIAKVRAITGTVTVVG